jgi:hypothetical protein
MGGPGSGRKKGSGGKKSLAKSIIQKAKNKKARLEKNVADIAKRIPFKKSK